LHQTHQDPNSKDRPGQRSSGRLGLNMPDLRDRRKQDHLGHYRQDLQALRMTVLPARRISGLLARNSNVLPDHYKRAHRDHRRPDRPGQSSKDRRGLRSLCSYMGLWRRLAL